MRGVWFLLLFSVFVSCERIDLDAESKEAESSSGYVVPIGHGEGTQEKPLTVSDMLSGTTPSSVSACWVIGYAVGSTYKSLSNAQFLSETTYTRNILLADDSLCIDESECIAVEFTTTSMQQQFSLCYHPEKWRQLIVLCGMWGQYFSRNGLRTVTQGYWLPDTLVSDLNLLPTEWEEKDIDY